MLVSKDEVKTAREICRFNDFKNTAIMMKARFSKNDKTERINTFL